MRLPSLKSLAGTPTGIPHPPAINGRVPKVRDSYPAEVTQEQRRITGVSPRTLHMFAESPARLLPKSRGLLKGIAGGSKKPQAGIV